MTALWCPKCGCETEALMDEPDLIRATPLEPTIRCGLCDTDWRIELHEVERKTEDEGLSNG